MATESEQGQEPERAATRRSSARREEPEAKQAEAEVKLPDIPVGQLIDQATGLLGTSPWTAAGALSEHDRDEKMSIDAAKAEIEKWLKQPAVKKEDK